MKMVEYWSIQISVNKAIDSLIEQQMRTEMWLGPHVRLAGMLGMAHIKSKDLAEKYLEACHLIFEKRYKNGYEAVIIKCGASSSKQVLARIDNDSKIISVRLETGNMVSNRKPEIP